MELTFNELPVFVLAGGLGTRLSEISGNLPKVLIDVNGKPFLWHVLSMLRKHRLNRITLCVAHRQKHIRDFINRHEKEFPNVTISYDSNNNLDRPYGSAAAVRAALADWKQRFWIINGDTFLDLDFEAMHQEFLDRSTSYLIAVCKSEGEMGAPNVLIRYDGLVTNYAKLEDVRDTYIDAGTALFDPAVFKRYSKTPGLPEIFKVLVQEKKLAGYITPKRFFHVNTPSSLNETRRYLFPESER